MGTYESLLPNADKRPKHIFVSTVRVEALTEQRAGWRTFIEDLPDSFSATELVVQTKVFTLAVKLSRTWRQLARHRATNRNVWSWASLARE